MDVLISSSINQEIRGNLEEKAKIVSGTVAKSHIIIEALERDKHSPSIQEYALDIQKTTDVLFVVVMDMDGIRLTHPNPDKIGEHFVGGDEKKALQGEEYISISKGTLGESVRAFTPIYNEENEQIGAVSVGISMKNVDRELSKGQRNILIGTLIGLLVGSIGAVLLARYIKSILFGLEPFAIAKILEERSTMLLSVREGIVAVDKKGMITLVNNSAIKIFQKAGLHDGPIGMNITEYMPSTRLKHVLETGEHELDEEQNLNGVSILVNRAPLIVNGQVVGAISTFRDKTDVKQLAEQLTGVKTYVEALRAQSHEFMNKLHVILGMVRMEFYDELSEYIHSIVDLRNQELGLITKNIKDPALAGFMMGKLSYAKEENVHFNIESNHTIPEPDNDSLTHDLVTMIGNLIDNSIEAMETSEEKSLHIKLKYELNKLTIEVKDTGKGMSDDIISNVRKKGFSTKGEDRGYGLYLVDQIIGKLNGSLQINSIAGKGTEIKIELPYRGKVVTG